MCQIANTIFLKKKKVTDDVYINLDFSVSLHLLTLKYI